MSWLGKGSNSIVRMQPVDMIFPQPFSLIRLIAPFASAFSLTFGTRSPCVAGNWLASLGLAVTASASDYAALVLGVGILTGIGFGITWLLRIMVVAYYFDTRRPIALGLALAGSGLGTAAFGPLSVTMIRNYGWRTSLLLSSFLQYLCVYVSFLYIPYPNIDPPNDPCLEVNEW